LYNKFSFNRDIIFYKFNFWDQLKSAISSYWNNGTSIGGILEDGFNACGHGIFYTKDFLQCFIKYTTLNRDTMIVLQKLQKIVNDDGLIQMDLFKQIIHIAAQNKILYQTVAENTLLKSQVLVLQTT